MKERTRKEGHDPPTMKKSGNAERGNSSCLSSFVVFDQHARNHLSFSERATTVFLEGESICVSVYLESIEDDSRLWSPVLITLMIITQLFCGWSLILGRLRCHFWCHHRTESQENEKEVSSHHLRCLFPPSKAIFKETGKTRRHEMTHTINCLLFFDVFLCLLSSLKTRRRSFLSSLCLSSFMSLLFLWHHHHHHCRIFIIIFIISVLQRRGHVSPYFSRTEYHCC